MVTIVVVALIVMFGLYLILTTLAQKIVEKQRWDIRNKNTEIILPLRLQAYERMCLFLERITPNHLLLRTAGLASNALEFQQIMLREIREEFNHNLAQQVYMSDAAWEQVKKAVNEVQSLINQAAAEVDAEAPANELGRRIFDRVVQQEAQPCTEALKVVKEEVQRIF